MKIKKLFSLLTLIVISGSILFYFYCGKKTPGEITEKSNKNVSLKKELDDPLDSDGEIIFTNNTGDSVTFTIEAVNSNDIWQPVRTHYPEHENFKKATGSMHDSLLSHTFKIGFPSDQSEINHIGFPEYQGDKVNIGYTRYRLTFEQSGRQSIYYDIDYKDGHYHNVQIGQVYSNPNNGDVHIEIDTSDNGSALELKYEDNYGQRGGDNIPNGTTHSIRSILPGGTNWEDPFEPITSISINGPTGLEPGEAGEFSPSVNPAGRCSIQVYYKWYKSPGGVEPPEWSLIKEGGDADTVIQSSQSDFDLKVVIVDSLYSNDEDDDTHQIEVEWNPITGVTVEGPTELSAGQAGNYDGDVDPSHRGDIRVYYKWYKRTYGLDVPPFVLIREGPDQDTIYTSSQTDFDIAVIVIDSVYSNAEFSDTIFVDVE